MKTRPQIVKNFSYFCIHKLSGNTIAPKLCTLNHECHHCAFDQWLDYMDAINILESKPKSIRGTLN